jgi:hypothetical protein
MAFFYLTAMVASGFSDYRYVRRRRWCLFAPFPPRFPLFFLRLDADSLPSRTGYAISLLKGSHGLNGWRWVFIVFGVITIGLGLISIFPHRFVTFSPILFTVSPSTVSPCHNLDDVNPRNLF